MDPQLKFQQDFQAVIKLSRDTSPKLILVPPFSTSNTGTEEFDPKIRTEQLERKTRTKNSNEKLERKTQTKNWNEKLEHKIERKFV